MCAANGQVYWLHFDFIIVLWCRAGMLQKQCTSHAFVQFVPRMLKTKRMQAKPAQSEAPASGRIPHSMVLLYKRGLFAAGAAHHPMAHIAIHNIRSYAANQIQLLIKIHHTLAKIYVRLSKDNHLNSTTTASSLKHKNRLWKDCSTVTGAWGHQCILEY